MTKKEVSIDDVMKNWYKYKNEYEQSYNYYFDEETNIAYKITNIYISGIDGSNDKEVELSFNYNNIVLN